MGKDGRTTSMINRLPPDGATIIVPRDRIAKAIANAIYETRGPAVEAECRILAIADLDGLDELRGLRGPVFLDHTFKAMSPTPLYDAVRTMVAGIRAAG